MIIRPLNRVSATAAVPTGGSTAGGSDGTVITAERTKPVLTAVPTVAASVLAAPAPVATPAPLAAPVPLGAVPRQADQAEPVQLELSRQGQVIRVAGELDIATAEKAYSYISGIIDGGPAPVTVDLSGLTFCDASGLGVLARIARHAKQAGRQLKLSSARPSLLKLMRLTGLDVSFPELLSPARAYPA
jgi:anti-sigma B factor antagonist